MSDQADTTQAITQPRIDYNKAVKLYIQGYPYRDIAHKLGCSEAGVRQGLRRITEIMENPDEIRAYRESEADLLDGVQAKLITSLTRKADDKKASVNNLAYAARQVFDMRRLSRGESTANVHQLSAIIQAADAHIPDAHAVSDIPDIVVDADKGDDKVE